MKSFKQYTQEQKQEEYISLLIQESENSEWQSFDSIDDFVSFLDPSSIIEGRNKNQNAKVVKSNTQGTIDSTKTKNKFKILVSSRYINQSTKLYKHLQQEHAERIREFIAAKESQENPLNHSPVHHGDTILNSNPGFKKFKEKTGYPLYHGRFKGNLRFIYQIIPNTSGKGPHTHIFKLYDMGNHQYLGLDGDKNTDNSSKYHNDIFSEHQH